MTNILKQIRLFIEYMIVIIVFLLLSLLPISVVSALGANILKFFGPLSRSHQIALLNFKKIFSDLNNDEIKKKVNKSWENLGRTIFELSILNKIVDKKNKRIEIKGLENIKSSISNMEQAIFFTIHQSNWEIVVPTIDQLGISVGAIYRHINNKLIDRLILKKRNQSINTNKSFYTPKGKQSAKDILKGIKNKSSMLVLIDQKDSAGENIKLFNIIAKTQIGFLKIARKYNLKLIPIKNTRHNNNKFTITFCPPINPFNKNISDTEAMLTIHKIIEKWIKENPTQWLWQHSRFN